MQRKDYPSLTVVMAEEPNSALAAYEQQFRDKFRVAYVTRSPFITLQLANLLRRGEFVGMQMDRHLGGPHVYVPFFGQPAPFPLGPATLARATGVPLLPTFIIADARRTACTFHVEPPIEVARTPDRSGDVRAATERLVAVYQRFVSLYPEQWFNFYDFWHPPVPQQPARSASRS
jgi:KDO2-lipid IV(A) lauroyltransferase